MTVDFTAYAERALQEAQTATSEADIQGRLESLLRDLLYEFSIEYKPLVNKQLTQSGLSTTSSDRPDSLFGTIVLDYKSPGTLTSNLAGHQSQVENYLNEITEGGPVVSPHGASRWAGILWDGFSITFCQAVNSEWHWTPLRGTSSGTLQTIVHFYRSLKRKPLTPQLLATAFGKDAVPTKVLIPALARRLENPTHKTSMLFREWRRLFQQVSAYNLRQLPNLNAWAKELGIKTDDVSLILFAAHTYYSVVVKLVCAELLAAAHGLTSTSLAEEIVHARKDKDLFALLAQIEDSELYRNYRITNFLEGDFFSWYITEAGPDLADALRETVRELLDFEPATALIRDTEIKDLLKEFYTSLVDEQIRHDLGEYYTPDWLAQRVLDKSGYLGQTSAVVLDPTVGSGTFLVEGIARLRTTMVEQGASSSETLRAILHNVRGMDLNPLAVISARANYILAIADLIFELGQDVEIPVYLADAINVPVPGTASDGLPVLSYTLDTELGTFPFEVPEVLVKGGFVPKILGLCDTYLEQNASTKRFVTALHNMPGVADCLSEPVLDRLRSLYDLLFELKERDWDRVWARIIQNNFSPRGFGLADFVVGNPPWVRWSRLPETYRVRVQSFCYKYGLVSGRGYTGGIESDISTVVAYSAVDNWLQVGGTLGFLITKSVFYSASARGFRLGRLPADQGIRVEELADLSKIQPFPDPQNETAVYVAKKTDTAAEASFDTVPCEIWTAPKARIPPHWALSDVLEYINIQPGIAAPVAEWGSPWFIGPKEAYHTASILKGRSKYYDASHRGTVSDANRVYWVKLKRYSEESQRALVEQLTDAELPGSRAYQSKPRSAWIEADLLYPLMRGRDCGRYGTGSSYWFQIIPNAHYANMLSEEEFEKHYPLAFEYFVKYRKKLLQRSTYRRYLKDKPFYAIYCVGPYSFSKYKVVWPEQQDPTKFRAAIVAPNKEAEGLNRKPVVPDHKLYYVSCKSFKEACYISAFLNSRLVREWLGGFMPSKQIGTTVFEHMAVPVYDPGNPTYARLVELGAEAYKNRRGQRDKSLLPEKREGEIARLVSKLAKQHQKKA